MRATDKPLVHDFRLKDIMKLSSIKRWAIIEMSRPQSVAEHSYNVAIISLGLIETIPAMSFESRRALKAQAMEWALCHDLTELLTGDLPTVIKAHMREAIDSLEADNYPKLIAYSSQLKDSAAFGIVKIADYVDAMQFAEKWCVDERKDGILRDMQEKLDKQLLHMEMMHGIYLTRTLEDLWRS